MGKTYFDLCNEVLEELFYETFDTFEELGDFTEGKKVKRMLNDALATICNNETDKFKFREQDYYISLVPGQAKYPLPNGYIKYMRYTHTPIVLSYIEEHKYLAKASASLPTNYWIDNDKVVLYPIPSENVGNKLIKVEYNTYDFAKDCCGILKPLMECEDDEPIIPPHHRDVLKWLVCAEWRASANDPKAAFYEKKYRLAYKALLEDQRLSDDYPNMLDIMPMGNNATQSILDAFYNPYNDRII